MSPFRSLIGTALGRPGSVEALASWVLTQPLPSDWPLDGDEVRQRVAIKLVTDARHIAARILDESPPTTEAPLALEPALEGLLGLDEQETQALERRFHRYVRAMLHNRGRDELRKAARHAARHTDPAVLEQLPDSDGDALSVLAAEEVLRAHETLMEGLSPQSLALLGEMDDLRSGSVDMQTLVDQVLGEDGSRPPFSDEQRNRARERLYKRHERARRNIEARVDALVREGTIDELHGDQLVAWILSMRRRILKGGDVSGARRTP